MKCMIEYIKKCSAPNFLRTTEKEQKNKSYLNSVQKKHEIGIKKIIQRGFEMEKSTLKMELLKKDLKEIEASNILLTHLTYHF